MPADRPEQLQHAFQKYPSGIINSRYCPVRARGFGGQPSRAGEILDHE